MSERMKDWGFQLILKDGMGCRGPNFHWEMRYPRPRSVGLPRTIEFKDILSIRESGSKACEEN